MAEAQALIILVVLASGSSSSGNDYSGGSSSSGGSYYGSSDNINFWQEDSNGNRTEGSYNPSTGDSWDSNGNYEGNVNDWLWD